VSYTSNNDGFTLTATKAGDKYVVSGTFDFDGAPTPSKVELDRDGRVQTFDAVAKLPADVEALLKTVEPRN
jgi:hypothetical protein